MTPDAWPKLDYAADRETFEALHLWSQIVGKARTACAPWLNHGWQVALYVSPRGLTTSSVPNGAAIFDMEFDFIDHLLRVRASNGYAGVLPLAGETVASFYRAVDQMLVRAGVPTQINGAPNEIADATPFAADDRPRRYDPDAASRLWRALIQIDRVFQIFRTGFLGKSSPVHFFWGSFDLAVTRFSGRPAPLHPGGVPGLPDAVTREAYSHEVSSAGFWPGGPGFPQAAFYAYAYPTPAGYAEAPVEPASAFWSAALGEWLLPYDAVRRAPDPDAALLGFLGSTHRAAAERAGWDPALECALGVPGRPRPVGPPAAA